MPLHPLHFPLRHLFLTIMCTMLLGTVPQIGVQAQILCQGTASYYSDVLHGRKMSNGNRYHRDSLTCAHKKLPFGTLLRVRNMRNNKEVVVKVTDRGPFSPRFVLDLSRAAARRLDILGRGHAPVEISLYNPGKTPLLLEEEEVQIPRLELQPRTLANCPVALWQYIENEEEPADSTETATPATTRDTTRQGG